MNESREVDLILEARRRIESGQIVYDVIQFLRDSGVDASDSIWILVRTGKLAPLEAKRLVIDSPVWADSREATIAFQEVVVREALRTMENKADPD